MVTRVSLFDSRTKVPFTEYIRDIPSYLRHDAHRIRRIVKERHLQFTYLAKKGSKPGEDSEEERPRVHILPSPLENPIPERDANGRKLTKKKVKEAEQNRREAYAQYEFHSLNTSVFDDRLPFDTKIEWNKRLLTTAGRANWK